MTKTDEIYLDLLRDIMENGVKKDTRAGRVKSIFGRQLRFDLKEGFPLLTTKKVFTKGAIHELLWFLQKSYNSHGSMNIEYLVRNGVHIWDDDAYRWFKNDIAKKFKPKQYMICTSDDYGLFGDRNPKYEYWIENDVRLKDSNWLQNITKEEFIDLTLQKVEMWSSDYAKYRFGDLGPVYGKQWRSYGIRGVDQIWHILQSLRNNPNDRRMLCLAYNPSDIEDMALPPCHVMMQFYTRKLTNKERMKIFNERYAKGQIPKKWYDWFDKYSEETVEGEDVLMPQDGSDYDLAEIPKYGLSCMWTQRSCDVPLGIPFNIASYALLTHIIAKVVNMEPDELVASLGDCHIYMNQMDGVKEQLSRKGSDIIPKLTIHGNQKTIEDFKYEDFEIVDYHPDSIIKFPLSVG